MFIVEDTPHTFIGTLPSIQVCLQPLGEFKCNATLAKVADRTNTR